MLRGLTTISFWAEDMAAAQTWYSDFLGMEPYFMRPNPEGSPAYIEFRLGDYQHELGIIDSRYAPPGATTTTVGAIAYWHVDDVQATYDRLLALGAKEHQPIIKRGEGFVTASVVDPFGNILGIMYNAHYLAVLEAHQAIDQIDAEEQTARGEQRGADNPVLEIVHFRTKPGVGETDVLTASAETQEWLRQMPGYLHRELSLNDDGLWIDIVHWRSLAEAQAAAQAIMQQPCAANFMTMLDPEQLTMYHLEQKQLFA